MFQVSFLLVGIQFFQHVLFHRLLPPFSSFYSLVKHLWTFLQEVFLFLFEPFFLGMQLLLLLSRVDCVWLCVTSQMAADQAPLFLGFSRQKHWRGLPFPSPMHACQVASAVSDSVRPHRQQPTRLLCSWDCPGKNSGVGCHFLLHFLGIVNLQFCVSGIQQFTRYSI